MYYALNNFVSCGNDVPWPSGRLMNQSIAIPTRVLMNNLHLTASEPPTSIICVWDGRMLGGTHTRRFVGPEPLVGLGGTFSLSATLGVAMRSFNSTTMLCLGGTFSLSHPLV